MPISRRRAKAASRMVLPTWRIAATTRKAAMPMAPHFMTFIQK